MSYDAETLYQLLPAIYRIRDAEIAAGMSGLMTPEERAELHALEGEASPTAVQLARLEILREKKTKEENLQGPLKSLLTAFAAEIGGMEENLEQLYDDLFIETCADWVIPYIGDLIGYEPLHGLGETSRLARGEVAHTIAMRRRKGTAAVLEQLAKDVTGWKARAVEFFQLLGTTQYMNHVRPHSRYAPDMRQGEVLARIGSAFDSVSHTVDVRRIENGRGRFNIPNIGIYLWRIDAYSHTRSPAVRLDDRRYLVSPLGHPLPLYTRPQTEDEITHIAEPVNVPEPIRRRRMADHLDLYYGLRQSAGGDIENGEASIVLYIDGVEIVRDQVVVCNLADDAAGWAHDAPSGRYAIDPELGRIAVAADLDIPESMLVSYHYGFSARIGGGEYSREREVDAADTTLVRVPSDLPTITAALAALERDGVIEIVDSGRYEETPLIDVKSGGHLTIRAAGQCRPTLVLQGDLVVTGEEGSGCTLEGLLVTGGRLVVPEAADLARLTISHTTLVPGLALDSSGAPAAPAEPGLVAERGDVAVEIDHTICGALRIAEGSSVSISDSILDATDPTGMAYSGTDGAGAGGSLSLHNSTVIGRLRMSEVGMISNSLLLAEPLPGDALPAVHAVRRQVGCVRFSWLPAESLVLRRYRCQPENGGSESDAAPHFTTLRYGHASYCQLARSTPDTIRRGADDESEMGAYHALFPAQREANLQIRLREFLRIGLAAGIFYES